MSQTETSPTPSHEQTVEPGQLYQRVVKYLETHPGPQTIHDLRQNLRPGWTRQKWYGIIEGMVECGALVRSTRGIQLNNNSTLPQSSFLPPELHNKKAFLEQINDLFTQEQLEKYRSTDTTFEQDIVSALSYLYVAYYKNGTFE